MSNQLGISIPQSVVWLLRIAVNTTLSRALRTDPMAFAVWYASIGTRTYLKIEKCGRLE